MVAEPVLTLISKLHQPRRQGFKNRPAHHTPSVKPDNTQAASNHDQGDTCTIVHHASLNNKLESIPKLIPLDIQLSGKGEALVTKILPPTPTDIPSPPTSDYSAMGDELERQILENLREDLEVSSEDPGTPTQDEPTDNPIHGDWLNTIRLIQNSMESLSSNYQLMTKDNLIMLLDSANMLININPSL